MSTGTIVRFVTFETTEAANEFRAKWEESNKLMAGRSSVTLQQKIDEKNLHHYLSQYRSHEDDIEFTFKKQRRSAHDPEMEMRVTEVGGYSTLQLECDHEAAADDCKIFVFLNKDPELKLYRELLSYHHLNIYQAYYESSAYTYILEFFVDDKEVPSFVDQLKLYNKVSEISVYKECNKIKKSKRRGLAS